MLNDDLSNLTELMATKAPIIRQFYRLKPKLCIPPGMGNVNVRWLATLQAEKKEPIATDPQQGGHDLSLPRSGFGRSGAMRKISTFPPNGIQLFGNKLFHLVFRSPLACRVDGRENISE